jgi:flavin reductase (DIM6/NTAB) family NADH-FMN oxidoreductase RutF
MSASDRRAADHSTHELIREDFRKALRGVASTVNVISTSDARGRYGMTATAVMSVSLDPPSLVVAVNKAASIHEPLRARKAFCVNVLAESHHYVGKDFEAKPSGADRFETGIWAAHQGAEGELAGLPYLLDAQSNIFCRLASEFSFGSHTLLVGTVMELRVATGIAPLLYCDGSFGSFSLAQGMAILRSATGETDQKR